MKRVILPVLHLILLTAIILTCLPLSAWATSNYVEEGPFSTFVANMPVALIRLDFEKLTNPDDKDLEIHIEKEGHTGFQRRKLKENGITVFPEFKPKEDSEGEYVVYNPGADNAIPLADNAVLGYNANPVLGIDKKVTANDRVFSFVIHDAASLPDGTKANVVLSYSNIRLRFRTTFINSYLEGFNKNAIFTVGRGNLFRTGFNLIGNSNTPYGILADVKMQICDSNGTVIESVKEGNRDVPATFLYTITDLDVVRTSVYDYGHIKEAVKYKNYSEQLIFKINSLVPGTKIHVPDGEIDFYLWEPYNIKHPHWDDWQDVDENGDVVSEIGKVTGVHFFPKDFRGAYNKEEYNRISPEWNRNGGQKDPGTFHSGFAALVNNAVGANYTLISSGNILRKSNGEINAENVRSYLFSRPGDEKDFAQHQIRSVTGPGGTIQTSIFGGNENGPLEEDQLEDGDVILDPGTYTIPTGKTMTYTMRPESEHMISSVIVQSGIDGKNKGSEISFNQTVLRNMAIGVSGAQSGTLPTGEQYRLLRTGVRTYNFTFYNNAHDHYIEVRWTFDITVHKEWEGSSPDARPDSVTFDLLKDGKIYKTGSSSKANNWPDVVFTDLEDGPEYKVLERQVPNYRRDKEVTKAIENGNNVVNFTNVYDPEHKIIVVLKYWDDQKDQDGLRPESARIRLIGKVDGKEISSQQATMSVSVGWEHIFEKLPRMYEGKEIKYEIEELDVPYGYTVQLEEVHGDFILTNQHVPETLDIHVVKHWSGDSDHPETRPSSAVLRLHNVDQMHPWKIRCCHQSDT